MEENEGDLILEQAMKNSTNVITFNISKALAKEREGDGALIIGRHSQCNLRLDSEELPCFISRQHARIHLDPAGNQLLIEDLQSRNGTFVNNVMIKPNVDTPLSPNDAVTFGCVSPATMIEPGMVVIQENAPFKFVLRRVICTTEKITDSSLPVPKQCSTFPFISSTSEVKNLFWDVHEKNDDTTRMSLDSGIVCDNSTISSPDSSSLQSPSASVPVKKRNISKMVLTPKLRAKRKYMADQTQGYVAAANLLTETARIVPPTSAREQTGFKMQSPDEKENNSNTTECLKSDKKFYATDVPCVSDERSVRQVISRNCEVKKISNSNRRKKKKYSLTTKKKTTESEVCSSFECKLSEDSNPNSLISWVQCDSCDKWFHTVCVGCDYDLVKSTFQQFRCGLC